MIMIMNYWYARKLQNALEYKKWQKFINVIENAKKASGQSSISINNHFTHLDKMVKIGSGLIWVVLN